MKHFLLTWIGSAVALLITANVLQNFNIGFEVKSLGAALIASVVIGLVNAIIRPVLSFFAFPITFITFGLFSFVINGMTLWLASALTPGSGFTIAGPIAAILGAIALSIVTSLINYLLRAVEG
ncbi:phage holin family protein [Calothrix sp. 336/3]|uniref:phage holin family protein n=1 Tax=Calothrix sp. 336/3 TaxID=1337936 RepID=UPI0004E40CCD|nr:phage holin family protein [Calothrix sp. 336/3]AKG23680.1 membrane protein [Calothrix sp. 336/3]